MENVGVCAMGVESSWFPLYYPSIPSSFSWRDCEEDLNSEIQFWNWRKEMNEKEKT